MYLTINFDSFSVDYPFLIVPNLVRDVIFSCDWMYDHEIVIDFNVNSLKGKFQGEVQHINFVGEIGSGANVSISESLDDETFEYKTEKKLYSMEEIS